jgi:hypothetical protein
MSTPILTLAIAREIDRSTATEIFAWVVHSIGRRPSSGSRDRSFEGIVVWRLSDARVVVEVEIRLRGTYRSCVRDVARGWAFGRRGNRSGTRA